MEETISLERGVLTITLDFELIWGNLDLYGPEAFRRACEVERNTVINRLLDLFVEYDMSATWCVVGHLFLDRCDIQNGAKHPEIVPPAHAWCRDGWFAHDPCSSEEAAPTFYGRNVVETIRACPVSQEIGCHSFSHVIFGDPGCTRETAESEVATCVRLAREMGIELRSFVFPRNRVGHLDVLRRHGFTCYRAPNPERFNGHRWPRIVKRVGRLWEVLTASPPPVVLPQRTPSGLWAIAGSMIYFPAHGMRRYVPISIRVTRAIKGLEEAVRHKRIFHLWFHPTNLAFCTDKMFAGLRTILQHADGLRSRGRLAILPMADIVPQS